MHRSFLSLAITAFAFAACSGGAAGTKQDSTAGASERSADGSSSAAVERGSSGGASRNVEFGDEQPRAVTLVDYIEPGFAIGFSDGSYAVFDPAAKAGKLSKVAKVYGVAAVSPSGVLALLGSTPPAIVNAEGELILQMNTVENFESAVFADDALALYVADRQGKVRIWGQAHSFEEDQHKEALAVYLNRQAPDFHVEFPAIRGPIAMTPAGQLMVGDEEGVVRLWDPTRPSSSKRIMKLDGHVRSFAAAEDYLYATSTSGSLKIGQTAGGYLPWTKDARGGFVAATDAAPGTYWQLDDGAVSWRNTEDGAARWELKLPAGALCGLAVARDASWLAACVGNRVVLVDAETGGAAGHMFSANDQFAWSGY